MYKAVKVFWGIFVSAAVLAGAAPLSGRGKIRLFLASA